jgi:hypothetical protein
VCGRRTGQLFDNFGLGFDASQRKEFWTLYGAIGVPFTFALAVAVLILLGAQFRVKRVLRSAVSSHIYRVYCRRCAALVCRRRPRTLACD